MSERAIGKTDLDCRREALCHAMNGKLSRTSVRVSSGGRWGPYHVTADRLNRSEMNAMVKAVLAVLGQQAGPIPEPERSDS